jgi:hypothetical protein
MVYNEPVYLPMWLKYYGSQLGYQNLFVIDHGTDDGSTNDVMGASRVCLPRTPKDNVQRTQMVSRFVASLLSYYDAVVNVDVDEFVVPDPRTFASLTAYVQATTAPATVALGMNVVHRPMQEEALQLSRPVLDQRRWVRLASPMCKPCLVRVPVTWTQGFHRCELPPHFDGLFLFHLRYFDRDLGLRRLAGTREMAWSSDKAGSHQRVDDATWLKWLAQNDSAPEGGDVFSDPEISEFVKRYVDGAGVSPSGAPTYVHEISKGVYLIPQEFRSVF